MITDGERRLIASECREMAYRSELTAKAVARVLGLTLSGTTRYDHDAWYRLADLIDPEHDRTWHDFSDELPPVGASVLCKGKNGALYVGKPVTLNGSGTRKVWVPRGDQYRSPEKWMAVDE